MHTPTGTALLSSAVAMDSVSLKAHAGKSPVQQCRGGDASLGGDEGHEGSILISGLVQVTNGLQAGTSSNALLYSPSLWTCYSENCKKVLSRYSLTSQALRKKA